MGGNRALVTLLVAVTLEQTNEEGVSLLTPSEGLA